MDEPENLTIRLLQEIRAEMRAGFDRVDQKIGRLSEQMRDIKRSGDGNSLLLAGLAGYIRDHEDRIDALENGKPAA